MIEKVWFYHIIKSLCTQSSNILVLAPNLVIYPSGGHFKPVPSLICNIITKSFYIQAKKCLLFSLRPVQYLTTWFVLSGTYLVIDASFYFVFWQLIAWYIPIFILVFCKKSGSETLNTNPELSLIMIQKTLYEIQYHSI